MTSPSTPNLDVLFPAPSRFPPSPFCPTTLAGHTDDSVQTLRALLKLNFQSHHIFINYKAYHNHIIHHLLAKFASGANSSLLRTIYDIDKGAQRPAYPSPGPIIAENYIDHLGNENYYQSYFTFFANSLLEHGVSRTLEEYVYSKKANYDDQRERGGRKQPEMLSRFLGGLLHPFIHLGYGLEFGIVGVAAEALAQTAVNIPTMSYLIPRSSWDDERLAADVGKLASPVSSLILSYVPLELTGLSLAPSAHTEEVSVFNILALIQKDDSLSAKSLGLQERNALLLYEMVEKLHEPIRKKIIIQDLRRLLKLTLHLQVERKVEELAWACALIYGVGGWIGNESLPFHADFGLVHLVTSSLFFPSIVAYLSPHATKLLLRSFLATALALWIGKARPTIYIKDFMASTSATLQEPIKSQNKKDTLTPTETVTPNPWLALTQSVIEHPDDHVCKAQRSLMHWAKLFGSRPAGYWAGGKEQLEGIELLDGTLFVRVAALTADYLGWMREGQQRNEWHFGLLLDVKVPSCSR